MDLFETIFSSLIYLPFFQLMENTFLSSHPHGQISSSFLPPFCRVGSGKDGCMASSESPGWNRLLEPFHSGFRPDYGMETALVTLVHDLWQEWDACSFWPFTSLQYRRAYSFGLAVGFGAEQCSFVLSWLLSPRPAPISVDKEWEMQFMDALLWYTAGFSTLPAVF